MAHTLPHSLVKRQGKQGHMAWLARERLAHSALLLDRSLAVSMAPPCFTRSRSNTLPAASACSLDPPSHSLLKLWVHHGLCQMVTYEYLYFPHIWNDLVKVPASKPGYLSLGPQNPHGGRTESQKLPSDLRTCRRCRNPWVDIQTHNLSFRTLLPSSLILSNRSAHCVIPTMLHHLARKSFTSAYAVCRGPSPGLHFISHLRLTKPLVSRTNVTFSL